MSARFFVLTVALAAFVGGVSACGKKGPLYLPKPAAPASPPPAAVNETPAPTPANSAPAKSSP